tara:strand:- start:230 stop:451 length:222 start_codon:yes stop_codon:yes gene_type:complete
LQGGNEGLANPNTYSKFVGQGESLSLEICGVINYGLCLHSIASVLYNGALVCVQIAMMVSQTEVTLDKGFFIF